MGNNHWSPDYIIIILYATSHQKGQVDHLLPFIDYYYTSAIIIIFVITTITVPLSYLVKFRASFIISLSLVKRHLYLTIQGQSWSPFSLLWNFYHIWWDILKNHYFIISYNHLIMDHYLIRNHYHITNNYLKQRLGTTCPERYIYIVHRLKSKEQISATRSSDDMVTDDWQINQPTCSIPGWSGLYSGRVSTCSGTSGMPIDWGRTFSTCSASLSFAGPKWTWTGFFASENDAEHTRS